MTEHRFWFEAIGMVGACLTTFSFLPQAIRIWRTTGEGPTPFDGIMPGPDLPQRTIDEAIRSLPRSTEAAHAP